MGSLRSNEPYVRLFLGRLVTNVGDSMYFIAAMWLVYDLTGSPFYTGIAGFLVRIPSSLQFLVGPLVDRWSLRRTLVGTQLVQCIAVLAVPIAAATGHLSVWLVLCLVPVLTFLNQFVYPAQNAALPRILDEDELVRANSLFTSAYQSANMLFNALSGGLIAIIGAVMLYVVDAVTFAIAVVLFWGLTIPSASTNEDTDEEEEDEGYWTKLREGIDYVRGSALFALMLGAVVANFAYGMMVAALPAFAALRGGPEAYGLLMAAMSAGILTGSVAASLVEEYPYGWISVVSYAFAGVCWFVALWVPWLWAIVALFFGTYIPIGMNNVLYNSMVQSAVDEQLLARVTAVTSSLGTAMIPIGSLLGGALAETVGSVTAMAVTTVAFGFISVYFLARSQLRSLPAVAETDEASLGLQYSSLAADDVVDGPETSASMPEQ